MQIKKMLGLALATVLLTSVGLFADDTAKPEPKESVSGVRLTKPYSELKDLTPDQTEKLKEIHKKFLEDMKVLLAKQKDDEDAVLTDDQKKEIAAMPKTTEHHTKAATKAATPATPAAPAAPADPAK